VPNKWFKQTEEGSSADQEVTLTVTAREASILADLVRPAAAFKGMGATELSRKIGEAIKSLSEGGKTEKTADKTETEPTPSPAIRESKRGK